MASINLTKLKPGKTYVVKVRAVDEEGNYSQYSFGYSFTVPATNVDGTQLTATNNSVVTALAPNSSSATGGALIAGGLDANGAANAGALNLGSVWNDTASSIAKLTGTANTGAVVINSTGILGYQLTSTSSGQANFFLDTASGNAYFRGTVYANAGQIGGFLIDTTSLSASSIYYNNLSAYDPSFEDNWQDYWVASATMTVSAQDYKFVVFQDNSSLIPQSSLSYATAHAAAGNIPGGSRTATLSASSFKMVMYKNAASAIAFSNSDLGMTIGNSYILSAYVSKPTSASASNSNNIYMQVNRYNASVSGTLTGSWTSSISPITSSSWTRLSVVLSPSSSEYYTISIIDPDGQSNTGIGSAVDAVFSVDSIQLVSGTTLSPYGYSNQVIINPSSNIPIKISSINNDSTLSNIFSVYTDGGIFANYFNVKKQSKINDIYFGAKKTTNISIGDFGSTHQNNTGSSNINIGIQSLSSHVSGSNNIMIGTNAGKFLQYGSNNVIIGGYSGDFSLDGNVVISDGAANIRIKADSTGLVTIPGSASIVGSVSATYFVGDGSRLTGIGGSSSVSYSSSAGYASSAGYVPVSGLSASSITIGSTAIGLGSTSSSLTGLTNIAISNPNSTTSPFTVSTTIINQNTAGGEISISTGATSTGAGGTTPVGGNINISTSTIGTGIGGATGGNITITTSNGSTNGVSGDITITSSHEFSISSTNAAGTMNNFNIGDTTPGTGNFTILTISGSSVSTKAYANSASLNAYNSASTYTQSSAWNNTSASVRYASSAGYVPVSGLSASSITIGSTSIGLGNTSASILGLNNISASSASISGTINTSSVIATQVTGGGMDLIYSGSIASTSGSVLIDNIFSSKYDNYRVTYTTLSTNSGTNIYFRYANSGVPSSSALYTYATLSNATSTTTTNSSSVIYHSIGAYATGATHVFEFYGPALTTTHMYKSEVYDSYVSGPTQQTIRGFYSNSSSFSGIVLATVNTGVAFNGTVKVYGYHN